MFGKMVFAAGFDPAKTVVSKYTLPAPSINAVSSASRRVQRPGLPGVLPSVVLLVVEASDVQGFDPSSSLVVFTTKFGVVTL